MAAYYVHTNNINDCYNRTMAKRQHGWTTEWPNDSTVKRQNGRMTAWSNDRTMAERQHGWTTEWSNDSTVNGWTTERPNDSTVERQHGRTTEWMYVVLWLRKCCYVKPSLWSPCFLYFPGTPVRKRAESPTPRALMEEINRESKTSGPSNGGANQHTAVYRNRYF